MDCGLVFMLLIHLAFSDYIGYSPVTNNVYRITEKGDMTALGYAPNGGIAYAVYQAHVYYGLGWNNMFTFNTSSKVPQTVPISNTSGLKGLCSSDKTSTLYSFNTSLIDHGGNYSLTSITPNGQVHSLSFLSIKHGDVFQQCVVDDANGVVYWVVYYAGASQELCDILMTDLKTFKTTTIYEVVNDSLSIFLGADGKLYVIHGSCCTTFTLNVATIPASGKATLTQLTILTPPTEVYGDYVGTTNQDTNSGVLLGGDMYVLPFVSGSDFLLIPLSPAARIQGESAAWVPDF